MLLAPINQQLFLRYLAMQKKNLNYPEQDIDQLTVSLLLL